MMSRSQVAFAITYLIETKLTPILELNHALLTNISFREYHTNKATKSTQRAIIILALFPYELCMQMARISEKWRDSRNPVHSTSTEMLHSVYVPIYLFLFLPLKKIPRTSSYTINYLSWINKQGNRDHNIVKRNFPLNYAYEAIFSWLSRSKSTFNKRKTVSWNTQLYV